MTVMDIVKEWLNDGKYDGLYNIDNECYCTIDDLYPCSELQSTCTAGCIIKCNSDDCEENDFYIGPEKK